MLSCIVALGRLIVVLFALTVGISPLFGQSVQKSPSLRITVDELSRAVVVGRLGIPLGTIVTIEGQYDVPNGIGKDFEFTMLIMSLNGKKLKATVPYDQHTWEPYLKYIDEVRDKKVFRLVGYETAEFSGHIEGEEKFDSRFGHYQRGPEKWGLHTRFHVIAILPISGQSPKRPVARLK